MLLVSEREVGVLANTLCGYACLIHVSLGVCCSSAVRQTQGVDLETVLLQQLLRAKFTMTGRSSHV